MTRPRGPIPDSYWVEPGKLCAGEYPFAYDPDEGEEKLRVLQAAGVDSFLDLTEESEYGLGPYAQHLDDLEYRRLPIRDLGVPSVDQMREILDAIDDALARGRTVYVHCFGGIGRTGTVIGCHLVRRGATPNQALESIAEWRRDTPDGHRPSPETGEQRNFIEDWQAE